MASRRALEYSTPPPGKTQSPRAAFQEVLGILSGFCFCIGVTCAIATHLQMAHRQYTPQYWRYLFDAQKQETQTGKEPPPFVGQRYVSASIWDYFTTHIAATAWLACLLITAARLYLWRKSKREELI